MRGLPDDHGPVPIGVATARRGIAARAGALILDDVMQDAGEVIDPPGEHLLLIQPQESGPVVSCDFGAGRFTRSVRRGQLFLTAPGAAARVAIGAPHRVRSIFMPFPAFAGVDLRSQGLGRLHAAPFADRVVADLIERLWRSADRSDLATRLEAEGLALLLIAGLIRAGGRSTAPHRGGLAGWQLRRTVEHLEANLARPVGIAELAAIAGLSPYHFARSFRTATGEPPHRALVRLRLERARSLLERTDRPVGEVAAAVGYETPQALARAFRRELGTTPGAYRRDRRG